MSHQIHHHKTLDQWHSFFHIHITSSSIQTHTREISIRLHSDLHPYYVTIVPSPSLPPTPILTHRQSSCLEATSHIPCPSAMASTAAATSTFLSTRLPKVGSKSSVIQARFGFGRKKTPAKKPAKLSSSPDRPLWYPGAKAPEWLDGSLVGDYGFDPFGLGKPAEYLQFDIDSLDQNLAKNNAGQLLGTRFEDSGVRATSFQPYSEVFGLQRFRECELIHGRWAMLATLGALTVESLTGVTWQDAGKVELVDGSSYLGQSLPFSMTALIWIEVLVIGYIEFQRNAELDSEKRIYPGGPFDPLGLASDPEKKERLQLAEIKHARLAMVGFLGFAVQAWATGKGPLDNWATHLSDPLHTTILDTLKLFS